MRENRLSGLEGGVADNGHPYPYQGFLEWNRTPISLRRDCSSIP